MTIDKLKQMVSSITKVAKDSEKLPLPMLSMKLSKYASAYPEDQTLYKMSTVLDQLSDKQFFITRAELNKLYQTFYTRNTKFAELFESELGTEQAVVQKAPQQDLGTELSTSGFGDSVLASALESAFDKNVPLKNYSKEASLKAVKSVSATLDAWNLKASHVDVVDGNTKFLVVKADYHTPKGSTGFYVPVEINDNTLSEPELFMGNTGPQDLNHSNIKQYITTFAGSKLNIKPSDILNALVSAASNNRVVSDAELAVIRLNSAKKASADMGSIISQEVDSNPVADVNVARSEESYTFEEKFSSPIGLASLNFGNEKVKLGSDLVARNLKSFGYKNHRVTVADSDKDTIFYGVSLDSGKVAFTVPVKVAGGNVMSPSVLVCDGKVTSFTSKSVNKLYMENTTDSRVAAFASAQYGLKPSELIENIRAAVREDNFVKAEDALNILKQAGDEKAYAIGFKVYSSGLAGELPQSASETTCSHVIKTANNQSPVCAHTGLAVNKVYQDKDGNCRPLYRKGMDESYEGAYFMNHKIFG